MLWVDGANTKKHCCYASRLFPCHCSSVPRLPSLQDGVLCDSEEISREAACEVMKELYGLEVEPSEFIEYTGTGEANFLGVRREQ